MTEGQIELTVKTTSLDKEFKIRIPENSSIEDLKRQCRKNLPQCPPFRLIYKGKFLKIFDILPIFDSSIPLFLSLTLPSFADLLPTPEQIMKKLESMHRLQRMRGFLQKILGNPEVLSKFSNSFIEFCNNPMACNMFTEQLMHNELKEFFREQVLQIKEIVPTDEDSIVSALIMTEGNMAMAIDCLLQNNP